MTVIAVLLALLALGLLAYLIRREARPSASTLTAIDSEQAVKAAVELHRIRRDFDASWLKSQQRREAAALRREIAEALRDD